MDLNDIFLSVKSLFVSGGFVMPPLLICTMLLWYGLGYRYWTLKETYRIGVRDMLIFYQKNPQAPVSGILDTAVKQGLALQQQGYLNLRRHLDSAFSDYDKEMRKYAVLIKIIVMISPLLGLLGTVSGMIETFDSLASMALFTQSGGIAGGISQALFTTQMGLAVAIPGVLIQSVLNRRQINLQTDLAQVKDLLCSNV
ncbi:flagellar motor protein MotA [Methyloprofundus sedimenti]|uniref:Flagellar motor protein MotA n=1 Tax=Methyloprofundus sedimenti TaxID=1420851 RepID=A0A1V8M6A8_9GAMM|nr:MotA/TolQ/ExbB proton channel family protein [Methyloprofundus sedimenti]OQK17087.1 flagellar motor protein MotA [Methyloprofundus sedimenti]